MEDEKPQKKKANLIRNNLHKAFSDKSTETLPQDLVALLDQLRAQDGQDED